MAHSPADHEKACVASAHRRFIKKNSSVDKSMQLTAHLCRTVIHLTDVLFISKVKETFIFFFNFKDYQRGPVYPPYIRLTSGLGEE